MGSRPSILVVDDDIIAAELLSEVLSREGYRVEIATHGREAIQKGTGAPFDAVITDLKMPDVTGLDVLKSYRRSSPQTTVFVITAFGSFETAIEAIQNGAYDYIIKPFKIDEIKSKVKWCLEQKRLLSEDSSPGILPDLPFKTIIGSSPKMLEIYKMVARASGSSVPVLIQGESGTGKELIARAVHDCSPRSDGPYVVINCAAFPETLLENELFGHIKGAFTNALNEKRGLFEEANGGTCFLDEIGDMPFQLQAKLLRVLQKKEIRRLGGTHNISIDVRFIAATNKDLSSLVKAKQFREDLFYRLHVVSINLPPLRAHKEDLPQLVNHFFQMALKKTGKEVQGISGEALAALTGYDWPGNIRQLENVIDRAITLTNNKILLPSDIPGEIFQTHSADDASSGRTLPTLEEVKLKYIEEVLAHTNGNQIMAADILGIDRKTLYRVLKKSGIGTRD